MLLLLFCFDPLSALTFVLVDAMGRCDDRDVIVCDLFEVSSTSVIKITESDLDNSVGLSEEVWHPMLITSISTVWQPIAGDEQSV